jgi:rhodanese-related sulfurtransferase
MNDLDQNMWRTKAEADANAVILDVRTPGECSQGVIPNAEMADILNGPSFMQKVASLNKEKTYYVYCRSGARSAQACRILQENGISCFNLLGGISAWKGDIAVPSIG